MNKQTLGIIAVGILVLCAIGFLVFKNKTSSVGTEDTLQVVASFYPMYFFASEIGGDKVTVTNITPAGAEPHDYEPSTKSLARIESADVLVLNGNVEPWGDQIKTNLAGSKTVIVTAGEGLFVHEEEESQEEEAGHEGESLEAEAHAPGGFDPHVWLDPVLAKQQVQAIAQGIIAADPSNTDYYRQNEAALIAKLDQLDTEFKTGLKSCNTKDIVTSHNAFAYLSSRYGLNQVAISGLSPEKEPSSQDLARVADFARADDIRYIFFETLVSPKLAQTISTEVGAQTLVLDPIEGILEEEVQSGKDYFTIMRENLKNLKTALQCTV